MPTRERIFERLAAHGCYPVHYDASRYCFRVYDQFSPISSQWRDTLEAVVKDQPPLKAKQLIEHPLIYDGQSTMIALPALRDYLQSLGIEERLGLQADVERVMLDTFKTIRTAERDEAWEDDEFFADTVTNLNPGFFVMRWEMEGDLPTFLSPPHDRLQTIYEGGRWVMGESWSEGIFEYGTNNAEMPALDAALYAGLGEAAAQAIRA